MDMGSHLGKRTPKLILFSIFVEESPQTALWLIRNLRQLVKLRKYVTHVFFGGHFPCQEQARLKT